jgi:hypothetical protein
VTFRSLRHEHGNAIVVVMGTLMVLGMLTATIASLASTTVRDAGEDRSSKRALAAAEAGVEIARLQLANAPTLAPNACLVVGAGNPTGAECPTGATASLGNGASYTYFVSQQLNGSTVTCPAGIGAPPAPPGTAERCITAIGTVAGETRRVQTLVRDLPGGMVWQQAGIVGEDGVEIKNGADIWAPIGTNGTLEIGNDNQIYNTVQLGPGGSITGGLGQITANPKSTTVPAWTLGSVDVPGPVPPTAGNPYNNAALPPARYRAAQPGQPQRHFTYSGASYTMPAGTYNFCQVTLGNGATLSVAGPVKIYIDSPARPGSGCTSGGRFQVYNSNTVNEGGNPANFVVQVYGTRNEAANAPVSCPQGSTGSDVFFCNSIRFTGAIYAPDSSVTMDNSVDFRGGVAAESVIFKNEAQFWWDPRVQNIEVGPPGGMSRARWTECRRQATTPADPESGC